MDRRHETRISIVQKLFSHQFTAADHSDEVHTKVRTILKNQEQINNYVAQAAPKFPIEKIARVDLSILQLAIYELLIEKKTPPKVIINEAIELAHELGSEKTPAFINAVLGNIFTEYGGRSNA